MKKYNTTAFICLIVILLLTIFSSFKPKGHEVSIFLKPMFGEKMLVTEKEKYVTAQGDTVIIEQWRFYISNVKLYFENGAVYKEKKSFHLIESDALINPGIILKEVPAGKITAITFDIGVDSLASVSGALDGALDPSKGMYWAWNSGYINAKLEGRSNSCNTLHNKFEFHIGGYLPPYQSIRPVYLKLSGESEKINLIADFEAWFTNIELSASNSILIPGKEAVKMADNYSRMFKVDYIQ